MEVIMIDTYLTFIRQEIQQQIKKVHNAIELEYKKLGTLSIEVYPSKKGISATLVIRAFNKPDEPFYPPYDNLDGGLFASFKDDRSFVLDAELALTSGGGWRREIADIEVRFKDDTDYRKIIKALLEVVSDKMIEEFHTLLPEINGNLRAWILERERKD